MYCGAREIHTKKRGRVRKCEWCGEEIIIGERYAKWLWYDSKERTTLYTHEECNKAWSALAIAQGGIAEIGYAEFTRPKKGE